VVVSEVAVRALSAAPAEVVGRIATAVTTTAAVAAASKVGRANRWRRGL
jgi:hypothetical protein